jgi:hypothetical protein
MRSVILALLLSSASAIASEPADIVRRAFAAIESDTYRRWAFTETSTEDEQTWIGRYDPGAPEADRWTLLSVDGREPSRDERASYARDRQGEFADDEDEDEDDGSEMINFDSLELLEESGDGWLFRFVPVFDDDEDDAAAEMMKKVSGRIKVMRDGHYPAWMELRNEKTIRPAFGAKISHFLTRLTFAPVGGHGPVFLQSIDVQVKGRAALVIGFDVRESTKYSDFEYVGD